MEKIKILIVDDESRMRKLIRDFLEREGYQILEAADGVEAMDQFYSEKDISLIILDVMMPRMDGWQVLREVREHSKVPIMMLTARTEEQNELKGFELGVDEYVSKPFSPKILVARVGALLKRARNAAEEAAVNAGGIVMDKAAHIVTIDGAPIDLSVKEFELLAYFLENQKMALSREKILNHVKEVGDYLWEKLEELKDKYDCIVDHRGVGLIQGLQFKQPAGEIIKACLDSGLVLIGAGNNTVRFVPPLIITKEQIDTMLQIIKYCIE